MSNARISPELTVADVARQHPAAVPVFERLGIDYCCGGKRTLKDVLAERGLEWSAVEAQLESTLSASRATDDLSSWNDAPLSHITGHIVRRYHGRLREDLPRLSAMADKVIAAHGDRHPELRDVAATLGDLRAELESHMMKEERILFPFIEQLEAGGSHPMLGHMASPIAVMEAEHDSAGEALASLRATTGGYVPPADACNTLRAYYDGLATLERELHAHIHLENNVLFPRAQALESQVLARA